MITPEIAEIISEALDDRLLDVHKALPGRVQNYNRASKTVDVEIGVRRAIEKLDGTYTFEDLGVISNVRILELGGAENNIHIDLAPGDEGLVLFCDVHIGQWRAVSDIAYPDDIGRHTMSGAVFVPGLRRDADVLAAPSGQGILITTSSGTLELTTTGFIVTHGANTVTVDSAGIKLEAAGGYVNIPASGIVDINGNFTVLP